MDRRRFVQGVVGLTISSGVAEAMPRLVGESVKINNNLQLEISVEREKNVRPLAEFPSLERDDRLRVRCASARIQNKRPYVILQRFGQMREAHGFLMVIGFVEGVDVLGGLSPSSFPEPVMDTQRGELVFTVPGETVTPFLFLFPLLADGRYDRIRERAQYIRTICDSKEVKERLLERLNNRGDFSGLQIPQATYRDDQLQRSLFLIPRIEAALKERESPTFRIEPDSEKLVRLSRALGIDPPTQKGVLPQLNEWLDLFYDPRGETPLHLPSEQQFGDVLRLGLTFLPGWYNAYLSGASALLKLAAVSTSRRVEDRMRFQQAQPVPLPIERVSRFKVLPTRPIQLREEVMEGGRKQSVTFRNVLVMGFGRIEQVRVTVQTNDRDGSLYLPPEGGGQLRLARDNYLSPDQLNAYCSELQLRILEGAASGRYPLEYDPLRASFLLPASLKLQGGPYQAVIEGLWGHAGRPRELSTRFPLVAVRPQRWSVLNVEELVTNGLAELRLLPEDSASRPIRVEFVYERPQTTDRPVVAEEISPATEGYVVRFNLSGRRPGRGRLQVYQPNLPPEIVTESSTRLPIQVFEALREPSLGDFQYYATDSELLVRTAAFPRTALPDRVVLDRVPYERADRERGEWTIYELSSGEKPVSTTGRLAAVLLLADGRRLETNLRVRPRRPAFTVQASPIVTVPLPFQLPDRCVSQQAEIRVTLRALEGYRFSDNLQLFLGGARLLPNGPASPDQVEFILDPRTLPQVRGQVRLRLVERREEGDVDSAEQLLPLQIVEVPESASLQLRFAEGRYSLRGPRLDMITEIGCREPLERATPAVVNGLQQLEFTGIPGEPIRVRLRGLQDRLVTWLGPVQPSLPEKPQATFGSEGGVQLRLTLLPGLTYQLRREGDSPAVSDIAVTAPLYAEARPLQPGGLYRWRLIATGRSERIPGEISAVGELSESLLMPPQVVMRPRAQVENGAISVAWNAALGASHYRIYRGSQPTVAIEDAGLVGEVSASVSPTIVDRSPLAPDEARYYFVIALVRRDNQERAAAPSAASEPVRLTNVTS